MLNAILNKRLCYAKNCLFLKFRNLKNIREEVMKYSRSIRSRSADSPSAEILSVLIVELKTRTSRTLCWFARKVIKLGKLFQWRHEIVMERIRLLYYTIDRQHQKLIGNNGHTNCGTVTSLYDCLHLEKTRSCLDFIAHQVFG